MLNVNSFKSFLIFQPTVSLLLLAGQHFHWFWKFYYGVLQRAFDNFIFIIIQSFSWILFSFKWIIVFLDLFHLFMLSFYKSHFLHHVYVSQIMSFPELPSLSSCPLFFIKFKTSNVLFFHHEMLLQVCSFLSVEGAS